MSEDLEVGGVVVARGERRTIELDVGRLVTDTPLTMPVHVIRGHRDGPTLFVSAAVHGDELNGVEIVRRLLKSSRLRSMRGTLLAVPVVNVFGFVNRSRYLPDRRDLNRAFPGSDKGSLAARMAHLFLDEIVERADYGIDLHTGALQRSNLPQIRTTLDEPANRELALAFGAPLVLHSDLRDGSLREWCQERNTPVLLYEGGEALRFNEIAIRTGLRGVLRVMETIGMLRRRSRARDAGPVQARESGWVRAPESGILREGIQLGQWVREGDRLAVIGDPMGETDAPVVAPYDGLIIGAVTSPLVNEGDGLYHVARPTQPDDVAERVAGLMPEYDGPTDPAAYAGEGSTVSGPDDRGSSRADD